MTMQTPTAKQAQRFLQSIGYVPDSVDEGVLIRVDGRGVPYTFELDSKRGIERVIRDIVLLHDLDPFVVRCRMLGFEPLTAAELDKYESEIPLALPARWVMTDLRIVKHMRATGTVQP